MRIYNTLSRKKEKFIPLEPGKVKIYVCGPTVYNYFHIGNARTFIFFDVVRSYFTYRNYEVTYVQNLTDIDDHLIEQAIKEKTSVPEIAEKYIAAFFADISQLGVKKADHYPKATEYIGEMLDMIEKLAEKGLAYEVNGDVYFSVDSLTSYGRLSGKKLEELRVGARVEENLQKRNPADFTLWKKAKEGEPRWPSPWGEGRPGWHTECVVMSRKLLGETIDIHGGAVDLIFPHHENELAQAEGISAKPFVRYWMHGGFLNIGGEKMSKSLDNFFLARDVVKKFDSEVLRIFFLSKHYRSQIDYNLDLIGESEQALHSLYMLLKDLDYLRIMDKRINYTEEVLESKNEFLAAMDDDFNTARSIAVLFDITRKARQYYNQQNPVYEEYLHMLVELGQVLGLFQNLAIKLKTDWDSYSNDLIALLVKYRDKFKEEKNWEMADQIRNDLRSIGIELQDTKEGTIWKSLK
ncbi:MAG: cysteine--tRNA ligase [Candidatus Cloacimonetes bacterium]|nr:cysteine--tRNA ligase [Candidatus Cloacimonadota bacterium]